MPTANARLLTERDHGTASYLSPVMVSEPVAGSGLYAIAFYKEGPCEGEKTIDKKRKRNELACFDDTDVHYVGLDAATGDVAYTGQQLPIARIGDNMLVQDPAATVQYDTPIESDTDIEVYGTTFDLRGLIIGPDWETLGSIEWNEASLPDFGPWVTVSGDNLIVFQRDRVAVYGPDHWSDPLWQVPTDNGRTGYNDGFVVGSTLIIGAEPGDGDAGTTSAVTAYNLADGLKLWRHPGSLIGTDGDRVMIDNAESELQAIDLVTGIITWTLTGEWGIRRAGNWLVRCDDTTCLGYAASTPLAKSG